MHQVNVSPGGVPKLPVPGAQVRRLGLDGDGHTEPEPTHGGELQAVSLYCIEALERVATDGHEAFPGAYGENLTLAGVDWPALGPGDRLAIGQGGLLIGGLLIELTKHAAPCETIAHWFVDRQIARIRPKVHPEDARWYARVIVEGPVAAGDSVEVLGAEEQEGGEDRVVHEPRPGISEHPGLEESISDEGGQTARGLPNRRHRAGRGEHPQVTGELEREEDDSPPEGRDREPPQRDSGERLGHWAAPPR